MRTVVDIPIATSSSSGPRRPNVALWATLGLLAIAAVWGSTFPMLKSVVSRVPAGDFLAVRFAAALVLMVAIRPRAILRLTAREWWQGLGMGVIYGSAQVAQTVGLHTTPASVSGFVTGMYVVFTPLLGALVLRRHISRWVWFAVGLSTAGLAALSLHGFSMSAGVALTLLGALLYAVQILGLGLWSTPRNAYGLTVVQLISVTAVCGIAAAPHGIQLPTRTSDWLVLVYMAAIAGAGAMLVQTWAQAHVAPTKAAVTMTMEPVWAGVFSVLIGGEVLGWRILVGGALVLAAMFFVELRPHPESDDDGASEIAIKTVG